MIAPFAELDYILTFQRMNHNHVHRGGSLTLESYPEKQTRPEPVESKPKARNPLRRKNRDAGAVCQLGRERGQIWVTGGNPGPPQPSPIEPNQQDRGSNQRGYAERAGRETVGTQVSLGTAPNPGSCYTQLLAGIAKGETGKLV